MAIPELLSQLLNAAGPSGRETKPAGILRDIAAKFAEVSNDSFGSTVARVKAPADAPTLALIGHVDEIGIIAHYIDDDGFVWTSQVGGWDPMVLIGQRVKFLTANGPVYGVIGKKPIHLLDTDERKKVPAVKDLYVDLGAKDGEEARKLVAIGDVAVIDVAPLELPNDRVTSRSMDNRIGCFVAFETARRVAESKKSRVDVCAVAAVHEETVLGGSGTTAFELQPNLAIVLDVTFASDQPGIKENELGKHPFGSGPVIDRGTTLNPIMAQLLVDTAEAESIPYTLTASGRGTGTDADAVTVTRGGIPTVVVSIPLRYMHSPVEMASLNDIEHTVRLLTAFCERLDPNTSYLR